MRKTQAVWLGRNGHLSNHGYGRLAEENRERAFWQSRAGLERPPVLVNIAELARKVRPA